MGFSVPFQDEMVLLRRLGEEDVEALHAYLNDSGILGRRNIPGGFPEFSPLSRKQREEYFAMHPEFEDALSVFE